MKSLFTIMVCIFAGSIVAQTPGFSCTAGEQSTQAIAKDPRLQVAKAQLDSFTRAFIRSRHAQNSSQRSSAVYVIPVVFHILHDGGSENISDSTVYREMAHWNEYMSATNAELSTTDAAFDTLIGNPQVEFRLAQKDPQGNCTNGIDRIYTQSTYYGSNNTKPNPWPREQYLNVWITKAIDKDATQYGTLAFSMYPSSVATYSNNDIIDGIICKYYEVGSNVSFSRPTLAHECGHWMNLAHTWGSTNAPEVACGDDDVDDTPLTKGNQNTCIHNLSVCTAHVIENEQNIMNYADCHFMFTKGQVDRMQAALNSPIAGRDSIWSPTNLLRTGTDQPINYPNTNSCAIPVADFAVNKRFVCTGQNVTFKDVSSNATITGRTWTFPSDASITSSTAVAPTVSFSTPGWKQVTMQAYNANGSNQKTKTLVYVDAGNAITAPYLETFDNQTSSQNNWQVLNYDEDNTLWQWSTAGHYSTGSFRMNMYNAHYDGGRDELVSPPYDLSYLSPSALNLSFEYSFATWDAAHLSDTLAALSVYGSIDCGNTWKEMYYKSGGTGLVMGVVNGPYIPANSDEYWNQISLNIPSSFYGSTAYFKFVLLSAKSGNHFYLENVNIGLAPTGIDQVRSSLIDGISIYPNPSSGKTVLSINTIERTAINITLMDISGREMISLYNGQIDKGTRNIEFDSQSLSSGVYIIKAFDGKTAVQKRFVKL